MGEGGREINEVGRRQRIPPPPPEIEGFFRAFWSLKSMESIGVLMVHPMSPYLEHELGSRFKLFKLWEWDYPCASPGDDHRRSIRAVVCCASAGADAALIESLPNLEIIASYSVGVDKIDLTKCREGGVRVTNTPDVLTDDVADLAIGLALAVLRRICGSHRFLTAGDWIKNGDYCLTTKLSGKSVGILGLGRIGSAIAKRAQAFGCPISYCSRTQKRHSGYKYYKSATQLASDCDILVVSCILTDETRHIINREVIDALGPKGILINIGRGAHVDEPELVAALLEGRLGGVGLDVFEKEPDVPEELLGLDNVVLQSHVGSDTVETCKDMAELVLNNLEAHFLNKPLLTPVV